MSEPTDLGRTSAVGSENVEHKYHTEADEESVPMDYDALLADRDGWKAIADERWQTIARLQADSGRRPSDG